MAKQNFILPKLPNPKGQAELILKGAGLAFIKPKFYRVNTDEIANEQFDSDLTKSSKFGIPTFDMFSFNCSVGNKITYTLVIFGT